jgi:hypothetical protein
MNPSKNFCIYRSIVKAAMQRAEKHQWQSGMVKNKIFFLIERLEILFDLLRLLYHF